MATDTTTVILGGGIGGIVAARELRRHLGAHSGHRIVLVDRSAIHSFPPSYLWVMLGWRTPSAIQRPLANLEKYGIEFHHAAVRAIRLDERRVETDRGSIRYDHLVVALGAELAAHDVPGLAVAAHSFYTLEESEQLASALGQFDRGRIAIVVSSLPYKCPPAPYEAAMLLASHFARKGTNGVAIDVYTPEPTPLVPAGPDAGGMLQRMIQQRGIGLYTGHHAASIDGAKRKVHFENGASADYELLIAIPPHRAPEVVHSAGLTNERGWIPVNERTLRTKHTNVHAIGDVTEIPLASGIPLPKAGVFASGQAEVVAANVARAINGQRASKEYDGAGYCFLETGNGRAGYVHGNFYAHPAPAVTLHEPSVTYHWGKVVFEKYWLWRWF